MRLASCHPLFSSQTQTHAVRGEACIRGESNNGMVTTTLVVHNIPQLYTRTMLAYELDGMGFEGKYNFVHLPVEKGTGRNEGYASVNFGSHEIATDAARQLDGYKFLKFRAFNRKAQPCYTSIAPEQGLERNVSHCRIASERPLILTL